MSAAVGGVLGGLILALGGPQLVAGLLVADARDAVWDVVAGKAVDPARIAAAAEARSAAARWEASAERETERGFLLVRQAESTPARAERERLLAEAAASIKAGLSIGPAQPYAWATLAVLREHAGDRRGAVDALRLSMLSGAFAPDLMMWRLEIGLRLLPLMDPETEALLRRQVRTTWVVDPDRIALLGAAAGSGPFVRRALEDLTESEIADYVRRHGRTSP